MPPFWGVWRAAALYSSRLFAPEAAATTDAASFRRSPAAIRSSTAGTSSATSVTAAGAGRTRHHQRDLPEHALRGTGGQNGERLPADLLVRLGQLTAERGAAVRAEHFRHGREGRRHPVGSLEEHHRPPLPGAARPEPGGAPPALRGRNPSKQNRSVASPDRASAVSTAEGPGTAVTGTPAWIAARTTRRPGSETLGIPASVTTRTVAPPAAAATSSADRVCSLCSW